MLNQRKSDFDRRSGVDRRLTYDLDYFFTRKDERRSLIERRSNVERRSGWLKISEYSSVFLMGTEDITILPEINRNLNLSI